MKTANLVAYILCACLLLTGCGAGEKNTATPTLGFSVSETRVLMNALAAPVLDALGGAKQYTEAASCAFDGVEKTYYYGSFYLTTYPAEDGDRIFSLWFADDTVATEEGVRIGSTLREVQTACPDAQFQGTQSCTLTDGNTILTIVFAEETVSSVLYEAIVN